MVTDRLLLEMVNRSVKPQRLWKETSMKKKRVPAATQKNNVLAEIEPRGRMCLQVCTQ